MSETFYYDFTDGSETVDIDVTVATPATNGTKDGDAYSVTSITGTVNGATITGEVGSGNSVQEHSFNASEDVIFDNAVFLSESQGDTGYSISGIDNAGLEFDVGSVEYNLYDNNGILTLISSSGATFNLTLTSTDAPCYCRGTMILTKEGEVSVEDLRVGDLVITKSGEAKPIRWIGQRSYAGRFAANNRNVLPVRIAQGALDENVPSRNLYVSPLHALFLEDVLIPARVLINGTSITQADSVEQVEYYHIELAAHDVILADGAWAESFVDDDSRSLFHNSAEYYRLYPDAVLESARFCAPLLEDGEELEIIRQKIAARASRIREAA